MPTRSIRPLRVCTSAPSEASVKIDFVRQNRNWTDQSDSNFCLTKFSARNCVRMIANNAALTSCYKAHSPRIPFSTRQAHSPGPLARRSHSPGLGVHWFLLHSVFILQSNPKGVPRVYRGCTEGAPRVFPRCTVSCFVVNNARNHRTPESF